MGAGRQGLAVFGRADSEKDDDPAGPRPGGSFFS
jgi:hypothetical protein